jgi:predicted Zn-dependent protease with MMP-like domain
MKIGQEEFEKLVSEAFLELPERIREKIDNVDIVIEQEPTQEQLKKVGVRRGRTLLGLYQGVPKTTWGRGFGMILPDKITIFKNSIEKFANSSEEVKKMVNNVVWHEMAHHFGYDERGIGLMEKKRKEKNR